MKEDFENRPEELGALADAMRGLRASEQVERNLIAEFRAQWRRKPVRLLLWRIALPTAALALAVAAWLPRPETPDVTARTTTSEQQPVEVVTDFLPVSYGLPLREDEFRQVIRVSIPRTEMAQFGLPVRGGTGSESVRADILIGEDGVARAIRFVE